MTLKLSQNYTQNPPVGTRTADDTPFTLLPRTPSTPIETIHVWETTQPDGRADGIAGLAVSWAGQEGRESVGRCEGAPSKRFVFGKRERIQIMYVYVGDGVDGWWFVTDAQKSFFPGKSSTRFEMESLGSGLLVGFEGWTRGLGDGDQDGDQKGDQNGDQDGDHNGGGGHIGGLGACFRT